MDSAEQAALSESDQDAQTQTPHGDGFYDARKINQYASDGRLVAGSKELLMKTMRRFERIPVNLTHSTVLATPGVDLNGLNDLERIFFMPKTIEYALLLF